MEIVKHKGIVKEINNGTAKISLLVGSECSGCSSKNGCNLSTQKEKIVEVTSKKYEVGDLLEVDIRINNPLESISLNYLLPFMLCFSLFTLVYGYAGNLLVALTAPIILLPIWYAINYLTKAQSKTKMNIEVKRQANPTSFYPLGKN